MKKWTSYKDSLNALLDTIKPYERIEKISLHECLDRVLARDILAPNNHPEFEISAMDGYAIKFEDQDNKTIKIIATLPAGTKSEVSINHNECVKTFTGSLICKGADTLIPIENVEVVDGSIIIKEKVKKGFSIRQIGESYKKDEVLLQKGTILSYASIALLAELGIVHVSVFVKPRIAVLATGSEIKDIGECLETNAQIRSSNHIALASMAKKSGCEAIILEIVKDKPELVKDAIINGLKGADILLTTGGVSVGDYDFVKSTLSENFSLIVDGAGIKPGRHIKIAQVNEKYIISLPGFPYSAMVMFVLYAREVISKWLCQDNNQFKTKAILQEDYKKRSPFMEFTACNLRLDEGVVKADLKGKKDGSSAIVNNLTNNAALLVVPIDTEFIEKGSLVDVLLMV